MPKAAACANGDEAPLLTLPLTRNPSAAAAARSAPASVAGAALAAGIVGAGEADASGEETTGSVPFANDFCANGCASRCEVGEWTQGQRDCQRPGGITHHLNSSSREPEHLHLDRPHAFAEVGETIRARFVGEGRDGSFALDGADRGARNRQSREGDLSRMLRGEHDLRGYANKSGDLPPA